MIFAVYKLQDKQLSSNVLQQTYCKHTAVSLRHSAPMNQTLSLMHLLGDTTQLVANSLYSGYIPKKKSNLSVIYNFIWQQICHYSDLVIYSKSVRLWLDTKIISCACNYHWLSRSHFIYFTGQSHSVSVHSPCYSLSSNRFKGEQISSWLHTVAVVLVELWSSIPVFSSVTLE